MRRELALRLHRLALRLAPEIALAVRNAIILELAAQHDTQQADTKQRQHEQAVAARAARQ